MRRIVLPLTEVGIGGETIAKILFCPELAETDGQPSSDIRIHWEYSPVAECDIARRPEPSLNRGLAMPSPYSHWLAHSYRLGERFLDGT